MIGQAIFHRYSRARARTHADNFIYLMNAIDTTHKICELLASLSLSQPHKLLMEKKRVGPLYTHCIALRT